MRPIIAVALCAAALTGACARSSSQAATPASGESAAASRSIVVVTNQRFYDMNIYVVQDAGNRVRLGTVTGNSSARFTIPSFVVGIGSTLRFIADPIGPSGASLSEQLNVQPGDAVQLTIAP
jgi:hypothetical protein